MNKQLVKENLLAIQSQVINDLKERIQVNHEMVDLDENNTIDLDDFSHQDESANMRMLLTDQLERAKLIKSKIDSIDFGEKTQIEVGAVVKTNLFSFVISIPTLPFQVENKQYIGISTGAPIFSVMKGKKTGDTFNYANNQYKIEDVF